METKTRISSIDIMRGLTLFLMLFVNDLNMHIAPSWLGHMKADFDGNVPFIVLSGLVAGLIIKKSQITEFRKVMLVFAGMGSICQTCRREFTYNISCSRYYLLSHLEFRRSHSHLQGIIQPIAGYCRIAFMVPVNGMVNCAPGEIQY
jgi:hypothetical protein